MTKKTARTPPAKPTGAHANGSDDWRARTLARIRRLIQQAEPEAVEERKWKKPSNAMAGVLAWSRDGIICTGETYKDKVKITFAKGARLEDPAGLFNASLKGSLRRAIDIHEEDTIDEEAFKALVRAAAALNASQSTPRTAKPRLLSGGNPQIPKGHGDAPVQAYIAAMPDWKGAVGRRLDALIERTVPDVRKAVKWNSPLYGVDGQTWFLSYHCFNKYVKVAFFRGAALRPLPPGASKQKDVRYLDIHEGDPIDEELVARWIKQASRLPGEKM